MFKDMLKGKGMLYGLLLLVGVAHADTPAELEIDVSNLTDQEIQKIVGPRADLSKLTLAEKGDLVGKEIDLKTVDKDVLSRIKVDGEFFDPAKIEESVGILTAAPQQNRLPEITNGLWSFHSAKDGECHKLVIAPTPDAIKDNIYLQLWWTSNLPDHKTFKENKSALNQLYPAIKLDSLIALEYDAADSSWSHGGGLKPNTHHNYLFNLIRAPAGTSLTYKIKEYPLSANPRWVPGTLDNYKKYLRFVVVSADPDLTYVFNQPGKAKNSYLTPDEIDLLVAHGFIPPSMSRQVKEAAHDSAKVGIEIERGLDEGYIDEDDVAKLAELEIKGPADLEKKLPQIAEAFGMEYMLESKSPSELVGEGLKIASLGDTSILADEIDCKDPKNKDKDECKVDCKKLENKDKDECKKKKETWFAKLTGELSNSATSAITSGVSTIFKKSFDVVGDYFAKAVTFALEGALNWVTPLPDCPAGKARMDLSDPKIKKIRLTNRLDTGDPGEIHKWKKPWYDDPVFLQ